MVNSGNENFPQIKRDLVNSVNEIKSHINDESLRREEVRVLLGKMSLALFGDATAYPPIKGYHQRIEELEKVEKERLKNKDGIMQSVTGAIAIAVGSAIIWIVMAVRAYFVKGH